MIKCINNGPELVSTNYWDSHQGENYFAFTVNTGVLRLLVPKNAECEIPDMIKGCDYVVVSTIPNPEDGKLSIGFLFEDHSDDPYTLHLGADAALGFFPRADRTRIERSISLWVDGPRKVATFRAYTREVPKLPCLDRIKF